MKKIIFTLFTLLGFISCASEKLPFKTIGFGGGFGGPQNESEQKIAKNFTHNPIIFVHGYTASASFFRPVRSWFIKKGNYNVHEIFAIQFSDILTENIDQAANELKVFVENVLKYTGREKAVIIGHSRGALITRYYERKLEGKNKVSHLVFIAGGMRGYTGVNLNPHIRDLIKQLNKPVETFPEIRYLCIAAAEDKYFVGDHKKSTFLNGAKNITIPGTDHIDVALVDRTLLVIHDFLN